MTSSITRGGHEPLPEMGEYVCDCYEHGTGEPWAHVGSSHVHERIVRCRDCKRFGVNCVMAWPSGEPDGFCAWGVRKED